MSTESTMSGNDFYSAFQKRKNDLAERLSSCEASSTSIDEILKQLTTETQQLRKDTVEASAYLPAYDRKTLENQLADLESRIQKLRQKSAPKGRFLFKKSAPSPAQSQDKKLNTKHAANDQGVTGAAVTIEDKPPSPRTKRNAYITATTLEDDVKISPELTLTDMDGCVLDFLERPAESKAEQPPARTTLHVKDIRNSALILGKMEGSVMLHNVERCLVVLKCHQLRIHNSKNLAIYLEVPSHSSAIIEGCSEVTFSNIPKDFWLIPPDETNETSVSRPIIQDFSNIMSTTSPNWKYLGDDNTQQCREIRRVLIDKDVPLADIRAILEDLLPRPDMS